MASGKVYLVGAGPGDPGLITLRAVEILSRADAVLYDYLVNPALLRHCRSGATLISLGKHGTGRLLSQAEINDRLIALATCGQEVVRLKSGDPLVFARAGEELDCLAAHGIPFEIIPGVTSGLAAASYAGIPVTHRDASSAVALVTGHEDAEKTAAGINYAELAHFPGTIVLYMGVTTVRQWSEALLGAGKDPRTPVAILRRVSFPDQRRIDTTLAAIADLVTSEHVRPPVVFVIGDVVAAGPAWSWFEQRPLFGQSILVTRPIDQCDDLARPLRELGANVLFQPAIEIRPIVDWTAVDRALARAGEFDWLVFSSANGVRYFCERQIATSRDARIFGRTKIAAIGPGTAAELSRYHLQADLVPDEFRAESLAETLGQAAAGKRFLLLRASRGREVLGDELARAGGIVEQVVVYESTDVTAADPAVAAQLSAGHIDWITVTSSAIARSLARLLGDDLKKSKLASISPITSATLRELGYEPAAEATRFTMPGVVAAILQTRRERSTLR